MVCGIRSLSHLLGCSHGPHGICQAFSIGASPSIHWGLFHVNWPNSLLCYRSKSTFSVCIFRIFLHLSPLGKCSLCFHFTNVIHFSSLPEIPPHCPNILAPVFSVLHNKMFPSIQLLPSGLYLHPVIPRGFHEKRGPVERMKASPPDSIYSNLELPSHSPTPSSIFPMFPMLQTYTPLEDMGRFRFIRTSLKSISNDKPSDRD